MIKFALSIAASDPSGGAGMEADLKVFSAHKVFGMSAITAITVQGPKGVEKIIPTPIKDFSRILEIVASQMPLDVVKIGALASMGHIRAVEKFLKRARVPCVLDPVLKASAGSFLLAKKDWPVIFSLLPFLDLLTPNIPEAEELLNMKIKSRADMVRALEKFSEKGARAVLLKGGHLDGGPVDLLWRNHNVRAFPKKRIAGKFHGTGCALSSAVAAQLALGKDLEDAVAKSERYVQKCLCSAVRVGKRKYLTHLD